MLQYPYDPCMVYLLYLHTIHGWNEICFVYLISFHPLIVCHWSFGSIVEEICPPRKHNEAPFIQPLLNPKKHPCQGMSPPISEDLKTITTTTYDSVILDSLKAIVISGWWFQPHLKNISQSGNLPQVGVKMKNIWNHQPVIIVISNLDSLLSWTLWNYQVATQASLLREKALRPSKILASNSTAGSPLVLVANQGWFAASW